MRRLSGVVAAFFGLLAAGGTADAACTSNAPASGTTVDCSGANATGVIASASTNVTLNLLTGGSIVPASGPSIWLGADADIRLQGGSMTGNDTLSNNYAVLIGDSSIVTLDGTIQSQSGITGPTQGGGSTGFSNALITIGSGGHLLINGVGGAALDGRAGGNTYVVDGEIKASVTSGTGIRPGANDNITLGSPGSIKTLSGDTSDAIDGFGVNGVTMTTAAGSLIEIHGIGRGIQLGDNADVTVGGTIRSYGDAAAVNSAGGVGVEVGANSKVWLKQGGQIVTGNASALGNQGSGGIGISAWRLGASNATIIVDGLIDTQRALGIFSGTGDDITIGSTGKITTRSTSHGIFGNNFTSPGNDTVTIDVAGRIEALGTGSAIYLQADNATTGVEAAQLHANVTVREGGSLFAQSAAAYNQLDGCCGYPEVIDNLVVAGTIARGNAGTAINLSDGADTITLLPTYSITGNIAGGSNADAGVEIDTFALDGGAGTSGAFNFTANTVTAFEAGLKKGLGAWTLSGIAGSGLNGTFTVQAGKLAVNGTMTSTDFAVQAGATLGGAGTIKSFAASGSIAPGNSIGILNTATAAFNAGSIYEVEISPADADRIVATGTATIAPSAMVHVTPEPGIYTSGSEYLILSANPRSGTFGSVTDTSAFLDFALNHVKNANEVWLTVSTAANFVDVAATPNQKAAAGGAQALGAGNPVFDAIVALDQDSARHAFDLVSGEIHASAKSGVLNDSRFLREAVLDRLRQHFETAFAPLGYAEESRVSPASPFGPEIAAWGQGYGSWGNFSGDGNAATFDRSVGGLVAGLDASRELWRFGVAAGYQTSDLAAPARASTATVGSYSLAAYGGFEAGRLALRAGASHSWDDLDTYRNATFAGFSDVLRASYGGRTAQFFGEAAYNAALGGMELKPFVGLAHVAIGTDGFVEQGGVAALTGAASSQSATFTSLGVRTSSNVRLGNGTATFRGLLAWQHVVGGEVPASALAFGAGMPFIVRGVPVASDALRLEGGMEMPVGPGAVLGLDYSGLIASGVQDHGLKAKFAVRF